MLDCCARLLEPAGISRAESLFDGFVLTLARTAVRQAFGAPEEEQWGELCFADRAGKEPAPRHLLPFLPDNGRKRWSGC